MTETSYAFILKFTTLKVKNEFIIYKVVEMSLPYCYYYKRVLILANIGDLVITAKFCACY